MSFAEIRSELRRDDARCERVENEKESETSTRDYWLTMSKSARIERTRETTTGNVKLAESCKMRDWMIDLSHFVALKFIDR